MLFENTWNQFVGGKIDYQNFSDHGWVMAVNASAETYDVVIGEKELLDNGEVDPAKIYRGLKATVPFSVVQYGVGDPVLVGYLNGDRNHPLVIGASDNIVMDVTKVSVNPATGDMFTIGYNVITTRNTNDFSTISQVVITPPLTDLALDGTHVFVLVSNPVHKLQKYLASDLSLVSEIGSQGSGQDQFFFPDAVCLDSTFVYVADKQNHRVVKRLKSDLSFVAMAGSQGPADNQFDLPISMDTDGTYLYIDDHLNTRTIKYRSSDLSFVAKNDAYYGRLTTDGQYVYITGVGNRLIKLTVALDFISEVNLPTSPSNWSYPLTDGTYIWMFSPSLVTVRRHLTSDLSFVDEIDVSPDQLRGMDLINHYKLFF